MKRNINNPMKWIGKRIDPNKWNLPDGFRLCAKTGKFNTETALERSFNSYPYERGWLIERHINIDPADWLSDEGLDECIDTLMREGVNYWL